MRTSCGGAGLSARPVPAIIFAFVIALAACVNDARAADDQAARQGIEFFESRIRPVLVERCYECHSAAAKQAKGRLRVDTREALLKGGDSGPALVAGEPAKSPLIKAIRWDDPLLQMPPKAKGRLTPEQVADFEKWVKMGAPDPRTGPAAAATVN